MPGLGTVLVGDDPGSHSYVAGKHRDCAQVGLTSLQRELPADATQAQVEAVVDELNADPACTGYIVQLPLPRGLDAAAALTRMDPAKDADGLHPTNLGRLVLMEDGPLPCTPRGIVLLLRRFGVELAGADVVVVGRGVTVGRPLGLLLTRRTENATVTLCHTATRDLAAHLRRADVVVAAAGVPGLVTADVVRPGAAVRRRRHHPHRGRPGRRRRARGAGGRRLPRPGAGRGRADDPGDAAAERRRERRARPGGPDGGRERVSVADPVDDRPPIRGGWVGRQWPLLTVLVGGLVGLSLIAPRPLPGRLPGAGVLGAVRGGRPAGAAGPPGRAAGGAQPGLRRARPHRDGVGAGRARDHRPAAAQLTRPLAGRSGVLG